MLFTAGNSLVSGGFLLFFAREFGATGVWIAVLSMLPETAGTFGLATRWIVRRFGGRRRAVWIACSLAARGTSLGIPLLALPDVRPDGLSPLLLIAACLVLSHALQAIAYVAYLSWLTDLVPETNWGRLFAKRNIAQTVVLLVLPVASGYLQDAARGVSPAAALLVYAATYGIGVLLMIASLLPLLPLPDVPVRPAAPGGSGWPVLRDAWRNRPLRFLLIHNWWLAFANGLTQAAFFSFSAGTLGVGRATYYLLSGAMQLTMIPVSWWAGSACDRSGSRGPLVWGVLVASCGLLFWLAATPERWWLLFGAYVLWGGFAAANIAGRNLLFTLAPRSDNSAHLALFQQIAGLLAGLSGLLGGLWLDALRESGFALHWLGLEFGSFQLLFAVSLVGRLSSLVWLFPVDETAHECDRAPRSQES